MPELSIIIPTLNEEKSLPLLLNSIKNQNYQDYEIILADANSIDKTKDIALEFSCKIVSGGMPAVGRNRGAAVAQGKYLLFLDADVILSADFLNQALNEIKNKKIDAASCPVIPLSDKLIDFILHGAANTYINVTQYFYPHAGGFCIFIKKDIHNKIKGFNEKLTLAEDHDYVRRVKDNGYRFRILKNSRIFISIRRLESDGRLNLSTKYVLCELYRLFKGEIEKNIFKYKFGHHYNKKIK